MLKGLLLGSVSLAICAAAPAWAQDAGDPGDRDAAGKTPAAGDIVVTAIRHSLETAQSIKRNSDQFIDSIVAEDIGKLPDISAAESAARITGLQVDREQGEATSVRIRGLSQFTTTLNGREIYQGAARTMNLQLFPSGSISQLNVYKSSTADLVEPGLAGLVDVRTLRPLDLKGDRISGSFTGVHWYQSQDLSAEANLLVSKRWSTGIGEIGILVNGSYTSASYIDATRTNALQVASRQLAAYPDPIRYPNFVNVNYGQGKRRRPSANFALQWKPNRDLEIYADGLYLGFRNRGGGRNLQVTAGPAAKLSNITFFPDSDLVKSMDATGGAFPTGTQMVQAQDNNTYQFGGGFNWRHDRLSVSGDLAYTESHHRQTSSNFNFGLTGAPAKHYDFDTDAGVGGATVTLSDFDLLDRSNYRMVGLAETGTHSGRHGIQTRLDAEYRMPGSIFDRFQLGIRATDNDASSYNYTQNHIAPPGTLYTSLPLDFVTTTPGFRNDDADSLRVFLTPSRNSIASNLDELRDLAGLPTPQFDEPTYQMTEKDYAGYVQAHYSFDLGIPIDGIIGLRAVRTEDIIHGSNRETIPDPAGGDGSTVVVTPITRTNSFTDVLPNISARLHPAQNFQIRLAVTKTRTRPSFDNLNPTLTINLPPAACDDPTNPDGCVRTASSGNSDLRPTKSTNYDASFEYYPSRTTSLTLGLFRRDVTGFISDFTVETDDPEYGTLRITRPDNGGRGKIQGVEAAFTTLFDRSWIPAFLHNFGVQANYTYLDHSSELPEEYAASLPGQQPIAGVSSRLYNLVGFYETKGLSIRVAYNHRSKFVVDYQQLNDPGIGDLGPVLPQTQDGLGTLDLAATVHPTRNVAFSFNASNILGASTQTSRQFNAEGDSYPYQTTFLESVYRVGVRFSF